uniref:B box-type domain-containing protein n=1 Tax=Glossina pallidipes TaxID=7398 RepID=A0A1B0AGZ6_GLOPL
MNFLGAYFYPLSLKNPRKRVSCQTHVNKGQIMERCNVCSEKAYLQPCAHCEKKICEDCKSAHMDILRREITRFNSQIRRSLHRLQDALALIEKNMVSLQTNCTSTTEEIDEIYRRVTKAIKDRSDQLKGEIDRYLAGELRNLNTLKENLDAEINNINSNCDIVDKYMNDAVDWDDCELMDTKEIFLKTVEFLRHFEYENSDYTRRVRFVVSMDPNQLVMNLSSFGDLNIMSHSTGGSASSAHLAPPSTLQPGLMRSKSDHRLASQYRQQEERCGYNDEPVLGGRKFGERPVRINTDRYSDISSNRYSRPDYDYDNDYDNEQSTRPAKSRFRSRFVRSHQNDDSDSEQQLSQRQEHEKKKDKVKDGEDASRGQLSGIIRLSDCARVIQRLAEIGKEKKEKKSDAGAQAAVQAAIQAQKAAMARARQSQQQSGVQRQVSEDDEINRIKRQNKNAPSTSSTTTSTTVQSLTETERPAVDRVAALKRNVGSLGNSEESDSSSQHTSPVRRTPPRTEVSVNETNEEDSNDSSSDDVEAESEEDEEKPSVEENDASEKMNSRQAEPSRLELISQENCEDSEEEEEEESEEGDVESEEDENEIENLNVFVSHRSDLSSATTIPVKETLDLSNNQIRTEEMVDVAEEETDEQDTEEDISNGS